MFRSMLRLDVVPAYGMELKGFAWGPRFVLQEPFEVWLSVLTSCMPFRDRMLCITMDDDPVTNKLLERARATTTFKKVFRIPLHQTSLSATRGPPITAAATSSSILPAAPSQLLNLMRHLPEKKFDAVVFCANTFSHLLQEAPLYIQAAYAALAPHGILGIYGHRRVSVSGSKRIEEDFANFDAHLEQFRGLPSRSTQAAHSDIFFPFSSVNRRWFECEYEVQLEHVVGHLRSWPEYQQCVCPRQKLQEDGANVCAFVQAADPLEVLAGCFEDDLAATGASSFIVNAKYFVVTCDNRPCNREELVGTGPLKKQLRAELNSWLPSTKNARK